MFKEFDTDLMEEFAIDYNKSKRQRRHSLLCCFYEHEKHSRMDGIHGRAGDALHGNL